MSNDFLDRAPPGSSRERTESDWSNMTTFQNFFENHFLKHVNRSNPSEPILLLLYDGHKSHISLFLTEWAKNNNVILFILPPHTSHLLQPLDVGILGHLKLYNKECQKHLRENPGARVTMHQMQN
jgi:hypothetical protein